ncbi:hypothetical protein RRG08_032166 [Elysia crispata]|uniref:C2 domain-containing protein n=1 Tax=Elysia crispata TaxID=231223 RepID=A0AAE1ABU9_9GAST|nr:hypothetical protein RRG08_032166 [Elysia crispata]
MSKQAKKQERHSEKKDADSLTHEIKVHTGLPPQVDGQIRCFCTLSVPQVIWTVPKPPGRALVRVKWWGETGDGVLFRPYDIKKGGKSQHNRTTAKYAVRSGPLQFATYLKDMGSLKLDVLTAPKSDACGQAQVPKIGLLTSSKPINGFFPVVSSNGEKLANLQVSLMLEPIVTPEDSVDMVPTTDSGLHENWRSYDPMVTQAGVRPLPHAETITASQPDFSVPAFNGHNQQQMLGANNENKINLGTSFKNSQPEEMSSYGAVQGKDLLSMIVDRGLKLRQAMVVSSLPGDTASAPSNPDAFSPSKLQMALMGSPKSGSDFVPSPFRNMDFKSEQTSISSDMTFDPALSMLADPMIDNSLLQDLFYAQDGTEQFDLDFFRGQHYLQHPVGEQHISQPARLLGGSGQTHTDDPKEDLGNKRPPSRTSSLASLNLIDQDAASNCEKKRGKRKARSRSRSKSTTRSRSRSNSNTRTDSQSNTPRRSAKLSKKSSNAKENVPLITKVKNDSKGKSKVRSRSRSSSRSRSRSRRRKSIASADDSIDIDVMSTARSETSGLVLTSSKVRENQASLSVDVLERLSRIHFAKVKIEHLQITKPGEPSDFPGKHKSGRPPRPQSLKRAGTYIIEYHFPMAGSSSPGKSTQNVPSDYITVPSQKTENEAIVFQHESTFPVVFDANTIEKWWRSALVFRLFHKETQGPALLVGSGGISLKSILRSQNLSVLRDIEIADSRRKNTSKSSALNSSISSFGQLKVSVNLASDLEQPGHHGLVDANIDQNFVKSIKKTVDLPVSSKAYAHTKNTVSGLPPQSPRPRPQEKFEASQSKLPMKDVKGYDEMTLPQQDFSTLQLHALLLIQEGCRTTHLLNPKTQMYSEGQNSLACNTYVVCKMVWCKDSLHSDVCWGTVNPKFNFLQVSPVHLTASLLERLKDNYIIVEVWDRRIGANGDKLIGMVKLSLQQFFLSFRNKKIARALLNSEYPVVAIDNFMPIVDPFSGLHVGQLKVLLAMGSEMQVANLKTVVLSVGDLSLMPGKAEVERRVPGLVQNQHLMAGKEAHEFSVQIDGFTGLKLSDNMIWGEADCFIQFFFPAQDEELKEKMGAGDGLACLKCFRTVTTLCTPDAAFHDTSVHKLTLPAGVPVQRELLTACAKSSGCVSGLSFEVWCRYYQPNIRDQLIAKCVLPLAKLSAMITMHKPGEQCMQAFSLKLTQVGSDVVAGSPDPFTQQNNAGNLNFSITYRKQQLHSNLSSTPANDSQDICLSVGVLRACGLKSAAQHVAQFDPSMKYPADVGVNAYVRINISLFGKENEKVTKTIAKSFAPEFSYFMDMSCPLVISNGHYSKATSLAEMLESGIATFEIWHQVSPTAYQDNQQKLSRDGIAVQKLAHHTGDILLGTSVIPLTSLLSRRTGLNGWFPINLPSLAFEGHDRVSEVQAESSLDQAIGGLELTVKFSHQDDRDRAIKAARNIGWSSFDISPEQIDWHEEDDSTKSHSITIVIDHVSFPTELALIKGDTTVNKAARCYIRYKFYDKAAVVTKSGRLKISGEGLLISTLSHRKDFSLPHTAPLQWYLREERLEIQAWLTFGREQDLRRSRQRDKWLGSCYIDLESLTGARRGRQRVSGLFPLFKPGTDNLKSAFVKADIVSRLCSSSKDMNSTNPNICYDESESVTETEQSMEDIQLWARNFTVDKTPTKKGQNGEQGFADVTSFGVLLAIERAMHLPMVTERNRSGEVNPTTYVSYQSAERSKPSYTPVFPNTCNPTWDYAVETRLNSQYLHDSNKNLVLKVWHKPADAPKTPDKSCDKVLGFVSVDLGPLNKGLQQICGWYNILDFNGQCRGQIKVSITPQDQQPVSIPSSNSFILPMFGKSMSMMDTHTQTVADQLVSLQQQLKHWMASQTSKLFATDGDVTVKSNLTGLDEDSSSATGQNASENVTESRPKLNLASVSDDTPTSYLFSSLRRQLEDLDTMTQKMKLRLSTTSDSDTGQQPINSGRSADILNGTVSGISTIHTASSLMNTRERFHAESSENGVSQELSHSRSINISTLEFPAETAEKSEQNNPVGPSGRFLDSGVFSSKNFYDRSQDNEPDSQRSGRSVSSDPAAGQDSLSQPAHRIPPQQADTFETGSHSDAAGKTQPFIPVGDSSETSGNSHGFMPDSHRVNDTNTLTSINFPASRGEAENTVAGTSSDAVSTLGSKHSRASGSLKSEQTVVYNDEDEYAGEDEDENDHEHSLYGSYHHYRALLDEEEKDGDKAEKREDEEEEGEIVEVVPRSLNNISTVLALQAKEDFGVSEENVRGEDLKLPHGLNTDTHQGHDSLCSGDNEDSFFQEVAIRPSNDQPEEVLDKDSDHLKNEVDVAVDQVQSLQISDVEDWLEKHVKDSDKDDQQSLSISAVYERAQATLNEMEDVAELGFTATDSLLKGGGPTTPRQGALLQSERGVHDMRLDLFDHKDEAPGNTFRSSSDVDGGVWRQDIEDLSDEEILQHRHTGTLSDKEVDEAESRLDDMHLVVEDKKDEPSAKQMQCLSKVQLENSSNSGESHRSVSSSTALQYGNDDSVDGEANQDVVPELGNGPSAIFSAGNKAFEYPFTLELEDLQSALKTCGADGDLPRRDHENSPLQSPHSAGSQVSSGSSRLDKTGDSGASKEQSFDKSGPSKDHSETNNIPERAYVDTNVDSTVDSAYVDSDSCHPSSAGINTSSKGAGSVYNFMQDDSGVGQLSHTLSGESSRIKLTNFFMPNEEMEASLRALQSATSDTNKGFQKNLRAQEKVMAASQLVTKLAERRTVTSTSVKNKRPPSAKEAKRIAKIFTSKAS